MRRRVRELKADLHRIRSAPFPSSYAKAKIKREIEALAMQRQPVVSNVLEHADAAIVWPTMRVRSQVFAEPRSLAFSELPHSTVLLVWLLKEPMLAALFALVDAESDDAAALTHEARQQREGRPTRGRTR
jgi:hypothetical protein